MTQEQIEQAAIDWRSRSESAYTTDAFKAGAIWARKEIVDNAWQWMRQHIHLIGSEMELHSQFVKAMLNEN